MVVAGPEIRLRLVLDSLADLSPGVILASRCELFTLYAVATNGHMMGLV